MNHSFKSRSTSMKVEMSSDALEGEDEEENNETATEKLVVEPNDDQNAASFVLRDLSTDEAFTDVTLVTRDGKSMTAHKNILSVFSPVFKAMFLSNLNHNQHLNSIIYITGAKSETVQQILRFMYHGQVELDVDEVERFLQVGKDFEIKGLYDIEENKGDPKQLTSESEIDAATKTNGNQQNCHRTAIMKQTCCN